MKEPWTIPRLTVYGDARSITGQSQNPCVPETQTKDPNFTDTIVMGQSQNAAGCTS